MAIRVLRLLEYVYESPEKAAEDMARWTHGIDPGSHLSKQGMKMRSSSLPFEVIEWEASTHD